MICATIGIDIMYNVSSIFHYHERAQESARPGRGCLNGLLYVGMSFFLGWADVATASKASLGARESFKTALFLGVGLAGAAALIVLVFIRIGKAGSELTVEEREEKRQLGEAAGKGQGVAQEVAAPGQAGLAHHGKENNTQKT